MTAVVVPATYSSHHEPGSPMWWVQRLHAQILLRRNQLAKLQDYYDGDFSLRYADQRLRQVFGSVFHADRFGLNFMRLVVNAVEERMQVQGIRVGKNTTDNDQGAWDIWQAADLDINASTVHHEALISGACYVCVWPADPGSDLAKAGFPEITVETPDGAIIEADPKNPRIRLAGLRIYVDPYGWTRAELFLPDAVYLYKSQSPNAIDALLDPLQLRWVVDNDLIPEGMMVNPWGVVPMVEFANVPRLKSPKAQNIERRSELWPVMPVQDAINSLLFNTLLTSNTQGFRQRWATGLEIPRDPESGERIEPFKAGIQRLWTSEDPNTKFGEFSQADIKQLIDGIETLINVTASISQVPPHYFNSSADRLSGESIVAAETGLVVKVGRKQVAFGAAWEEVMRLAGMMSGNAALAAARNAEVMWRSPETRSIATMADAATKLQAIGVPWQAIMEFIGYSPDDIRRLEDLRKANLDKPWVSPPLNPSFRVTEQVGGPGMPPAPDVLPGQGEGAGKPVPVNPGQRGSTSGSGGF